jgi:hypothetical protein
MDLSTFTGSLHECSHCRPFWRAVANGSVPVEGQPTASETPCPACGRRLVLVFTNGLHRCVECGIVDVRSDGHVIELWWSEDPAAGALSTGWGGSGSSDLSCGARDEDEPDEPFGRDWAAAHAAYTGGRVILPADTGEAASRV